MVSKAYHEYREADFKGEWERMRESITPQALLPLEWDKQKPKTEFASKEENKMRLERRLKKGSQ